MFKLCYLPDISKWNLKNLIKTESIFKGCKSLIDIPDISKWNINNKLFDKMPLYEYISFSNYSKTNSFDFKSKSKENESSSNFSTTENSLREYNILPFEFDDKKIDNDYYEHFFDN